MAYDYKNAIEDVINYYNGDSLQKRFSALITGESNAGKTYMLRTCRMPLHVDSFDPGGTKSIRDLIRTKDNPTGQVIADTRWEDEDPYSPKAFALWKKAIDLRLHIGYFNAFGTYVLDSATSFGDAIINDVMGGKGRAGEVPQHRSDYNPQKVEMTNYIKKLMRIPCDFIMTGHLREIKKLISLDTKTGIAREEIKYRFYTTGQAVITIPLLFDEIYVIIGEEGSSGTKRKMLMDASGTYMARSRLKLTGLLNATEEPNIKALLKKVGLNWEDKPKL